MILCQKSFQITIKFQLNSTYIIIYVNHLLTMLKAYATVVFRLLAC